MLNKLKRNNSKGFTIIEVMIVLAIAGLILLIVFLAIPALQRNSRNTQRKSDIGRLGSAATTVVSNLNGQPVSNANFSGGAGGTITTEAGSLGYYQAANITAGLYSAGLATNRTNADQVVILYNANCNGVNAQPANRQTAIMYSTETGGNPAHACLSE